LEKSERGIVQNRIGFLGLLTLIFITLKLVGTVHWSWAWVLAPIWIPVALWFVLAVLAAAAER
jgi:hypothetical protein